MKSVILLKGAFLFSYLEDIRLDFIEFNLIQIKSASLAIEQSEHIYIATFVALIPVVVAFSFIVFVLYRQKREIYFREVQLQLKLEKSHLEMKALRSQINPHFIFNCLNSIQHFIHKNESNLAENYLVKFSRLIRLVLENSTYSMVPMAEDLRALELYIQMEQLRLNNSFSYELSTQNINVDDFHIPPLLIQPFVENSIWHGLSNVKNGFIAISFSAHNDILTCSIEDNGKKKTQNKKFIDNFKTKSMGLDLIKQRLNLLQRTHNSTYTFQMHDIFDDQNKPKGKRIDLTIPYE